MITLRYIRGSILVRAASDPQFDRTRSPRVAAMHYLRWIAQQRANNNSQYAATAVASLNGRRKSGSVLEDVRAIEDRLQNVTSLSLKTLWGDLQTVVLHLANFNDLLALEYNRTRPFRNTAYQETSWMGKANWIAHYANKSQLPELRSRIVGELIGRMVGLDAIEEFCARTVANKDAANLSLWIRPADNNIDHQGDERKRALRRRRESNRVRIAREITKIIRELRNIRPQMHNAACYNSLENKYRRYLVFSIAQERSDVRTWVENIQYTEIREISRLAAHIVARHEGTINSDTAYCYWASRGQS